MRCSPRYSNKNHGFGGIGKGALTPEFGGKSTSWSSRVLHLIMWRTSHAEAKVFDYFPSLL